MDNEPQFSAHELARWCNGRWRNGWPQEILGFSIDTRSLARGELFVALEGRSSDGHAFVSEAFRQGASGVVVSKLSSAIEESGPALLVSDTYQTLQDLALNHRKRLRAEVVGLTGSMGKTSVKEMVAQTLSLSHPTAKTHGNWNNHIGLPLSLLRMSGEDRYGVFEIGINHPGECAPLCELLQPKWGIITSIGAAHLAHFESVEAIAREKGALVQALPPSGVAAIGLDNVGWSSIAPYAPCPLLTTSLTQRADYSASFSAADPYRFELLEDASGKRIRMELSSPGEYMVQNALLAIAILRHLEISWSQIYEGLKAYRPPPLRWEQQIVDGKTFILDAYNANPLAMKEALKTFAAIDCGGKKWLVLGGMCELGSAETEEHQALGKELATHPWGGLIVLGPLGQQIAQGAKNAPWTGGEIVQVERHQEAVDVLKSNTQPGDFVFLKASRAFRLEEVLRLW